METYRNIYVTFKVTLKCNLACEYCYGRDNHAQGAQMSDSEVFHGLDFVKEYALLYGAERVSICWHGGEPLLLSKKLLTYIDYANAIFADCGIKAEHGTQTNATLLTPATYGLIKGHFNGFIGVSLDLFSRYRKFPSGEVSTDRVVRNIDMALAAGIRCGAINLITQDNLHRIPEIYDFYKLRNMNVRLARVFPISESESMSSAMYVTDEEYAQAMIEFFDLWANDPKPAHNTDIVKLISDLLLGVPSICLREANCHQRYLAFSPGGDIFSCAEFDVPSSVIGNFLSQSPNEFLKSDIRDRIAKKAPVPQKCSSCKYNRTCNGGCFRERFMLGYPYRCKSNIIYWDHVLKWIEGKGGSLYILLGKTIEEKREIINRILAT